LRAPCLPVNAAMRGNRFRTAQKSGRSPRPDQPLARQRGHGLRTTDGQTGKKMGIARLPLATDAGKRVPKSREARTQSWPRFQRVRTTLQFPLRRRLPDCAVFCGTTPERASRAGVPL